jgi:hypothetical protein
LKTPFLAAAPAFPFLAEAVLAASSDFLLFWPGVGLGNTWTMEGRSRDRELLGSIFWSKRYPYTPSLVRKMIPPLRRPVISRIITHPFAFILCPTTKIDPLLPLFFPLSSFMYTRVQ